MTHVQRITAFLLIFKAHHMQPLDYQIIKEELETRDIHMSFAAVMRLLNQMYDAGLVYAARSEMTFRTFWALSGKGQELLGVV